MVTKKYDKLAGIKMQQSTFNRRGVTARDYVPLVKLSGRQQKVPPCHPTEFKQRCMLHNLNVAKC